MSKNPWEREYRRPTFITGDDTPQKSVLKFFRFLKKQSVNLEQAVVLDIGCGLGRNSLYAASLGATATGYDISDTAICEAIKRARGAGVEATFEARSIVDPLPLADNSVDIVLDVTASNALTTVEREAYLKELERVMKPGAYLFLRTLAKDGDDNAKRMIKQYPGPEADMYQMPKTNIVERVFTRTDLLAAYQSFTLREMKKTTSYTKFLEKAYKRNFFLAYFQSL